MKWYDYRCSPAGREFFAYGPDGLVAETFASFVDGSTPLTEWDNYQKTLDQLGRNEVIEIYQEAYEDYLAR